MLDGQYKLFVRNGDTLGDSSLTVGLEASAPENKVSNSIVNFLGHLSITHRIVSTSEKVKFDNADTDGEILMSIKKTNRLGITNVGVDVYGDLSYSGFGQSSDFNLKEKIKEMDTKKMFRSI